MPPSARVATQPNGGGPARPEYPARPRFFAHRFVRLMTKACLATHCGSDVFCLLAVIAHQEDARGYRGPVRFFNGQLAPLVGCGSDDALARVRAKAVAAGWLVYQPGGKGRAGEYWVAIPDDLTDWDDGPTDEGAGADAEIYHRKNADISNDRNGVYLPQKCGDNRGGKNLPPQICGDNRGRSAEHSSLTLSQEEVLARAADGGVSERETDIESIPSVQVFVDAWNEAGLIPRTATSDIRGKWQRAWRDFAGFRDRWRSAVEHAGRQARCRPGGEFPLSPEFLLGHESSVERVLGGEFNDRAAGQRGDYESPAQKIMRERAEKRAKGGAA